MVKSSAISYFCGVQGLKDVHMKEQTLFNVIEDLADLQSHCDDVTSENHDLLNKGILGGRLGKVVGRLSQ